MLKLSADELECLQLAQEFRADHLGHFYEADKFDQELATLLLKQRATVAEEVPSGRA